MIDERNDRNKILALLYTDKPESVFSKKVVITGDEKLLSSNNGRLMAETLVNLVSRFSNKLYILVPDSAKELKDKLIEITKGVGTEVLTEITEVPDVVISIGNVDFQSGFTIRINSNGWVALVSCNQHVQIFDNVNENSIGSMGAACFGAAETFKRLLEISGCTDSCVKEHPSNFTYSFLDHSISDKNLDFPSKIEITNDLLLIGAGAVGSAFVYALSKLNNLSCPMTVVDPDSFDGTNLNRCLIAFSGDVGNNKAVTAEKYANSSLKISGFNGTYKKYVESTKNSNFPIVISTVDKDEPRYEIQSDLPKRIFHGGTFENKATVAIVNFLENACMCCMFESKSSHEELVSNETGIPEEDVKRAVENNEPFSAEHVEKMKVKLGDEAESYKKFIGQPFKDVYAREICGMMKIQTDTGTKNASVSFVSFYSGLVLVTEIIKLYSNIHGYPLMSQANFIRINLFIPTLNILANRPKNPHCFLHCTDEDIVDIFKRKWNL